jgi:hypothetical protein
VVDEYGSIQPSGPVTVQPAQLLLPDPAGKQVPGIGQERRVYRITVKAADVAGNTGSAPTLVTAR